MLTRQQALRSTLALIGAFTWVAVAGCGTDSSTGSGETAEAPQFSVTLSIQPSTSLRTEETVGLFSEPIHFAFETDFVTAADADHGEEGHDEEDGHGKAAAVAQDGDHHDAEEGHHEVDTGVVLGSTTMDGLEIRVQSLPAMPMWHRDHDGMEAVELHDEHTHHLVASIEDVTSGHAPHGHANVPEAEVQIEVMVDGEVQLIELNSVQGPHGLRYEANGSMPPGTYDLTVHVEPPHVMLDETTKDRWAEEIEASLPGLAVGDSSGSVEVGGMVITVRTGEPTQFGSIGSGMLPMIGDETVGFSVRLEDPNTEATGSGEIIAHSEIIATIHNEDSGESTTVTMSPMYGAGGFHFGANLGLPGLGHAVDGHDDSEDEHGH